MNKNPRKRHRKANTLGQKMTSLSVSSDLLHAVAGMHKAADRCPLELWRTGTEPGPVPLHAIVPADRDGDFEKEPAAATGRKRKGSPCNDDDNDGTAELAEFYAALGADDAEQRLALLREKCTTGSDARVQLFASNYAQYTEAARASDIPRAYAALRDAAALIAMHSTRFPVHAFADVDVASLEIRDTRSSVWTDLRGVDEECFRRISPERAHTKPVVLEARMAMHVPVARALVALVDCSDFFSDTVAIQSLDLNRGAEIHMFCTKSTEQDEDDLLVRRVRRADGSSAEEAFRDEMLLLGVYDWPPALAPIEIDWKSKVFQFIEVARLQCYHLNVCLSRMIERFGYLKEAELCRLLDTALSCAQPRLATLYLAGHFDVSFLWLRACSKTQNPLTKIPDKSELASVVYGTFRAFLRELEELYPKHHGDLLFRLYDALHRCYGAQMISRPQSFCVSHESVRYAYALSATATDRLNSELTNDLSLLCRPDAVCQEVAVQGYSESPLALPDVAMALASRCAEHLFCLRSPYLKMNGSGANGFGVQIEMVQNYFDALLKHSAFVYDADTDMLRPAARASRCETCSSITKKKFEQYHHAVELSSQGDITLDQALQIIGNEPPSSEPAEPKACFLWNNKSAERVLQTFVTQAILAKCSVGYLLDPILWHADWYDVMQARLSAGSASITAILQCESNEQLRSFAMDEFDDCHEAIAYLVDECSVNKKAVCQVHDYTTKHAHMLRNYPPSVVCAALSGRRYGEEAPPNTFWNDPRHLLCLCQFPSLEEAAYDYECSFPSDLATFRRSQRLEIVDVLPRFEERVQELALAVRSAEGDAREAMASVIRQYTRVFGSLRGDRAVMFFSLYVYNASPEKRRALYRAVTARNCVVPRAQREASRLVSDSGYLPAADAEILAQWSVGSTWLYASDPALVSDFRGILSAGGSADGYDVCTLSVRVENSASTRALPIARTCARLLVLPPYDKWEDFERAMDVFLENAGTFTRH